MSEKRSYFKRRWSDDPIGLIISMITLIGFVVAAGGWYIDRSVRSVEERLILEAIQEDVSEIKVDVANLETAVANSTVTTGKVVTAVEILTGITIDE